MCGIVALAVPHGAVDEPLVARMRDRLAHRGPDGAGLLVETCGGPSVALAHRRLSIIDLSDAAAQPMSDPSGATSIVFNGEIYNYVELREELAALGEPFRTRSDTEVLLAAYRRWGTECLSRLNGMFAFAVLDRRLGRLLVARDRFGEKPLFLARPAGGGIAFASEMKALFAHPGIPAEPDEATVDRYVAGRYLEDDERTFFRGVERVPPATAMLVDVDGTVRRRWRYWTPDYEQAAGTFDRERDVARFRALLERSVRLRLRSDVPVGSSLSGGLDSSTIVAILATFRSGGDAFRQHTFSARFDDDPTLSEGEYVDAVVARTGATPHAVTPRPEGLVAESRRLHWHQEEPFLSASIYLQWCVARLARAHDTTVLLDGQGADELLGGYQFYFPTHQLDLVDRRSLLRLRRETRLFTRRLREASTRYRDSRRRFDERVALTAARLVRHLVRPSPVDAGPYEAGVPRPRPGRRLRRQLAEALQYNSLPMLLRYADRNSMAFGRETRLPYLDHDLVDFCLTLPDEALVGDGWQKRVLRLAAEGLLPGEVQWRADKVGYAAPLDVWLRGPMRAWAHERLFGGALRDVMGAHEPSVRGQWERHLAGGGNLSWALWRWISLGEWLSLHRAQAWSKGI